MQLTSCRRFGQPIRLCLTIAATVLAASGCGSPQPVAPVAPVAPVVEGKLQSFRSADAKDLKMLIGTQKPGADGFPAAIVQMWNNSSDEVLVEYQPTSVVLHCGPYEQHGPANVFGRHREVLDPQQELDFDMRAARWSKSPTTGPRDLMLPTELPKGKYEMWATFRMPEANPGIVESERDTYEVP